MRHDELAAALLRRGVPQDGLHFLDGIGQHRVGLHALLGAGEQAALDIGQRGGESARQRRLVDGLLDARIAPLEHDLATGQIARPQFQHRRHPAPLPVKELGARRLPVAIVHLGAHVLGDAVRRLQHLRPLFVLAVDRHQHRPDGRQFRRQHQALIVGMRHDQPADEPRADSPTGLPHILELPFLALELDVERLAEVLPQVVTRARLQRQAVLHHGLDGVAALCAGELLGARLHALDHRHRHDVLGHLGVQIQNAQHFFQRFLVRGVRRVSLLPEKLRGAQKHSGAQFPADHVGPLIEQHRQIAPAMNPLGEEVAHDGLRRRPDHVRLFQLLAAGDGHHRQFRREAFHVLGLFAQETLRNEQREIDVLVIAGLEASIEFALQHFPDRIAIGFDDHAALDDFGRFGHVALQYDILIPGGKVLRACGDGRFSHMGCNLQCDICC